MPWFRIDDGLHSHPKWLATSLPARGLWTTAGSWCAAQVTDGVVPRHVLPTLGGTRKQAQELVTNGLWLDHDQGWVFHDWLHFQPSAEQVAADRTAARERQRKAREKAASRRDSTVTNGVSHGVTSVVSHAPVTPGITVPPTRPDPTPLLDTSLGVTSSPAGTGPDQEGGVDFEHHPKPQLPEDQRAELVAGVRSLRPVLAPTPDDAA